jgi:hypothetical protein
MRSFCDVTSFSAKQERCQVTGHLIKKIEELEKWQRLTVGRELKMNMLKKEIKDIKKKLG